DSADSSADCWFERVQLRGRQLLSAQRREGAQLAVGFLFVEYQLEDAFAVQRNEGACNFSQRFEVTRIQVARGECECMRGTFGALDARRQHAGGGARRFAGVVIGDNGNVGATGRECGAGGEANQAAADDDYVAPPQQGGVAFSWIRHVIRLENAEP